MLSYNNSADLAIGTIYKLYGFMFPNISQSKNYLNILMLLQWAVLLTIHALFTVKLNLVVESWLSEFTF